MALNVLMLPSFYSYPDHERVGSFFRDQAEALARAGTEVVVAFVEPRSLRDLSLRSLAESHWHTVSQRERGVLTLRQKGWNTGLRTVCGGRLWALLLTRFVLRNCSGPLQPTVIHAHNALYAGLAAEAIAKRLRIPYVITEHASAFLMGAINAAEAKLVRRVYAGAHAIVSVSSALARAIAPYCGGKPVAVIPNVVDTELFQPSSTPRTSPRFRVLAAGNLNRNKGFNILIRSFAAQFRGSSECELVIAGEGPERRNLETLAIDSGIESQTLFPGGLTRQQLLEAMWSGGVFVISSYHETFGVVAIEAIATGLPVIATRCGGPEDIITPETGWLVRCGDVREMGEALRAAREGRRDLSGHRDRFVNRFSMSSVASTLLDLYQGTANQIIHKQLC